ncbi:MAG: transcription-repair coupling factor [Candidatus Methylomirabilales bacterium]
MAEALLKQAITALELARHLDAQAPATLTLHGLTGASRALVAAACIRATGRPALFLTGTAAEAEAAARDCRFSLGASAVGHLPELPGDPAARAVLPPELTAERLHALGLLREGRGLVVAAAAAASGRFLTPEALERAVVHLHPQRLVAPGDLAERLTWIGYRRAPQVGEPGEFSVRGGILDIHPPLAAHPVRVEFVGDAIESLRTFDPETQRSMGPLPRALVLPVIETLLDPESRQAALAALDQLPGGRVPPSLREALEAGRAAPGLEAYLPCFPGGGASLLDYLPPEALCLLDDPDQVAAGAARAREAAVRADARWAAAEIAVPPAAARLVPWETLRAGLASRLQVVLSPFPLPEGLPGEAIACATEAVPAYQGRLQPFLEDVTRWLREGFAVTLVARSEAQARRLQEILREHALGAALGVTASPERPCAIAVGEVSRGFRFPALRAILVTEAELFGTRRLPPPRRAARPGAALRALEEMVEGDLVVHVDHGIARYQGLQRVTVAERDGDYLILEYASGDRLYVPVENMGLVQRYVGAEARPPALDRLGGAAWARAKARVKASVRALAKELLQLYAARQILPGHAFAPDAPWQREFEASFPYEETADQLAAIQAVKADMERPGAMDRLICGDVGYGKTEVAMRAAFKAAMDGKQVAVLVPTTVLAMQHFASFSERFAPFPLKVEMLSRFRSRRDQQAILQGLRDGTVDIVIGTHRLLQRDVRFRDLGLLVVDEEHRFGVAAKERLKHLRREVDALTLTATPIPRTLHMAMLGVRDVSTIETPPEDRLAIRTYVCRFDPAVIQDAVEREVSRGGQVFFVHNRVESIHTLGRYLKRLLPHVRIVIAHGQQPDAALERVMVDFYARKYDLLLCTTIIESGLDIPTANTIIVNRADRFGLAQLYQLRGRVGRDRHRAHAYLLIPREEALSELARRRLQVLVEFTELGSGFKIAARDLEIRGAGNLLGAEQHGQIAAVGFDLYCRLIQETIQELKGQPLESPVDPAIRLPAEALLPDSYVDDPTIRLALYKRLAAAEGEGALEELEAELRDRFGPPPPEATWLLTGMALRLLARRLRAVEVDLRTPTVRIRLDGKPAVDGAAAAALLQESRGRLRYGPADTLAWHSGESDAAARASGVKNLLRRLAGTC